MANASVLFFDYSSFNAGAVATINGTTANSQLQTTTAVTGNLTVTDAGSPTTFDCTVADCGTLTFTTLGGATTYNSGTKTYTFAGGSPASLVVSVVPDNFSLTPDGSGAFLSTGGETTWNTATVTNIGGNEWMLSGTLTHNSDSSSLNDLEAAFGIPATPILPYVYINVVFNATQGGTGAVPSLTFTVLDSAEVELSSTPLPEPGTFLFIALGAIALILLRRFAS